MASNTTLPPFQHLDPISKQLVTVIQCHAAVSAFPDCPAAPPDPPWTLPFFLVGGIGLHHRLAFSVANSKLLQLVNIVAGYVHTNKISVLEIEPVQLITCLFRVHDILVHDKSGSLGVVCNALTYLSVAKVNIPSSFRVVKEPFTVQARTCQRDQRVLPGLRCSCDWVLVRL